MAVMGKCTEVLLGEQWCIVVILTKIKWPKSKSNYRI